MTDRKIDVSTDRAYRPGENNGQRTGVHPRPTTEKPGGSPPAQKSGGFSKGGGK